MKTTANRPILILVALYLLVFWSDAATYRPGMDSMTYGSIARQMLENGTWLVPHYTEQAYAKFFQHPPLGLWLMAVSMGLVRTLFGDAAYHSDLVLKLLPSLFGGISVVIVYLWGRRIRGENFAFFASLVLLTSMRFVKYSKGFMLDPFLATFSLLGVYLAFRAPFRSGLSIAAAFLSKGLFAFAPLAVAGLMLLRAPKSLLKLLLGVALPIGLWFAFGDAANYLHHYYIEHVAGRIGPHPFVDHLAPGLNLVKVYWPWLPFFFLGIFTVIRTRKPEEIAIALSALAFLGGFTLVASFLEQYHTAFYPFAALVVAMGFPRSWIDRRPQIEKGILAFLGAIAVFMLFFPHALRSREFENPLRNTMRLIRSSCPEAGIHRMTISTGVAEIWYALSIGSWYTDFDPRSDRALASPTETKSELLFAMENEPIHPDWEKTSVGIPPYRVYRKQGSGFCGKK